MRRILFAGALTALLVAAPAAAQQPTTPRQPTPAAPDTTRRAPAPDTTPAAAAQDTTVVDTVPRHRVKSGVAFYRSLLVPGWGQISGGAYKRAAVFITLQGTSDFMLIKTLKKLSDAEKRNDQLAAKVQDSLRLALAPGGATPDSVRLRKYLNNAALFRAAADSLDASGHALVISRKKQREDWITLAVFWTLVSGMDAFINAQLQDFPADIGVEPRPGGGMLIRAAVPVRRFW